MDESASPLSYHPIRMTINGVTKSVLVPLPKTRPHGHPLTAKLPDGSAVIITANSVTNRGATATVADKNKLILATVASSTSAAASALLARQNTGTFSILVRPDSDKRSILKTTLVPRCTHQPVAGVNTAVSGTARPRVVTLQAPSGQRHIVRISAPPPTTTGNFIRLPLPIAGPISSSAVRLGGGLTRPIILRRSQTPVARSAPGCAVVQVRTCLQSATSSVLASKVVDSVSSTSALTVVSGPPRTLSRREATAAGWGTDGDDQVQPEIHQLTIPSYAAVRHIVPMDTDDDTGSDIGDSLPQDEPKHDSPVVDEPPCDAADTDALAEAQQLQSHDERMDNVIEIFPDDADAVVDNAYSDHEDVDDTKPAVLIKTEYASAFLDDEFSRRCSSVSTETAASDAEPSTSNIEDFVVLAEWSQDEVPTTTEAVSKSVRSFSRHRKRKSRRWSWQRNRVKRTSSAATSSSSSSVYLARRTGGRPKTAAERYGIVDCFVSLPVLQLPKPYVDKRNWWRHVCCPKNQIQRCRCKRRSPDSANSKFTPPDSGVTASARLIRPSMVASGSATLPVQMSGPTSPDGVTPLVVRQPDGSLASVVAKRTTPGGTALDANKKKYLLIKTKTGSFLVPVNRLPDAAVTAAEELQEPAVSETPASSSPPPSPPTSCVNTNKSETTSDKSGHRERIEQLKERLRQEEERLNSIRSQLNCNSVQKFDL